MNARTDKKRNSNSIYTGDLTPGHKVGARQRRSDRFPRGGGYPDNCIYFEILRAEKKSAGIIFSELREIGLRDELIQIAEKIGADNFLLMWHFLDCVHDAKNTGRFRVAFPSFDKYKKHLRNQFIKNKLSLGLSVADIVKELNAIGFKVSERTVWRVKGPVNN